MDKAISRGSIDTLQHGIQEQDNQENDFNLSLAPAESMEFTAVEQTAYFTPGDILDFPPIENDKDFIDALDVYSGIPDLDPDKQIFGNAIADYQTRQINFFYDDPAQKAAVEKRRKKEEAIDALTRDWKKFPDARKKAVDAFGEGFALNWEAATLRARKNIGKNRLLEELYKQDEDGEFDSYMRYKETNHLMGNVDVWKHYIGEREKIHQEEEKQDNLRKEFNTKSTPMVGALIQGKTFMESIDSIPDLTQEERNWAYVNCCYSSDWYKSVVVARDWAKEAGVSFGPESDEAITNQSASELGRKLLYLKKKDPVAHSMVVGIALTEIENARNNGTAFISPFARTLMSSFDSSMDFFSRFTVGEFFKGDVLRVSGMGGAIQQNFVRQGTEPEPDRFGSPELAQEKAEVRAMMAEIAESPDGASWIRRTFDGLGKMSAQTAYYLGTQGMGTFTAVSNDRFDELYGNGNSLVSSLLRAGVAGGTEAIVERLGGEFFGRNLQRLAKKMPGVQRFSGYIGGASDMLKAGLNKQAALLYGAQTVRAGFSELAEELIQPTLQAPLDSSLAYLFGNKNGMSVQDWKDQLEQACSPDLVFQMMIFGAACGLVQTPAMAREAKIARMNGGVIQTLTRCSEEKAVEISKIVDPVEKRDAIIKEGLGVTGSMSEQKENMLNGIKSMKEDFSWLAQQKAYQAEVDQLNLPHVEDLGDGTCRFTTTLKDEQGNITQDVLVIDEQAATARMNILLDEGIRQRMVDASNEFAINESVGSLPKSGKYVFEGMGKSETIQTARKLAAAARLCISEGIDANAPGSDLGMQMIYNQAAGLDAGIEQRVKLWKQRGEICISEPQRSNAYRVAMRNGQTLIRYNKGDVSVSELLEEVLGTHLEEDMGNTKHELDWYVGNLRAVQETLLKDGYMPKGKTLIKKGGGTTIKDVVEGMSTLAKGDVMVRATEMRLPVWMKDFIQMVRQWVSSAKALLDLGNGLHEMERRRLAGESVPISEEFTQAVYALSNNMETYWIQEGMKKGETEVQKITDEAGSGMAASFKEELTAPNANQSDKDDSGIATRISRKQRDKIASRIAEEIRADAITWGRYDGKTDEAAFLVNMGKNIAMVKRALMYLPARKRVNVKPHIDRLKILAELAATGWVEETAAVNAFARREIKRNAPKGTQENIEEAETVADIAADLAGEITGKDPTRKPVNEVFQKEMREAREAWAEKPLNSLMADVIIKASEKMGEIAREGIVEDIEKMLEKALEVKVKEGSQKLANMSVYACNYIKTQISPMLEMTAKEKEAAINKARTELEALEQENPDQINLEASVRVEELNKELTALTIYGNLKGMSLDEAETAARAIEAFIKRQKEAWVIAQEYDAERLTSIGREIVSKFEETGERADENTLQAANEAYHGNDLNLIKIGEFMENMDQLFKRMQELPATKDITKEIRSRLSNAFREMREARGNRAAAVQDIFEEALTKNTLKKRGVGGIAGWVEWFKTTHDTGLSLSEWTTREVRLTIQEAIELREMNAEERKKYVQVRWEHGKKYISGEVISVLLDRLGEHETSASKAEESEKQQSTRKYVTAKVSVKSENSSPLVISRDNALQAILLSEQTEYREQMKEQGYTPELLSALREYVGEEGMAIGYGLRDLLKLQGDKLSKLYEKVTGVPFPRVQNYYPARFWELDAMTDTDAATIISGVPTSKGKAKAWQQAGTNHNRKIDPCIGAISVFFEATDITDHWYYTQDIIADLKGMMKKPEVAESLAVNLGKDDFVRLRRWVDLLERAGVVQGQAVGALDKTLDAIYSGQAKAILAFRMETMLKQGAAVLNAWIGDSSIGLIDYLLAIAKLRNGSAKMGIIKMMKSPEYQARLESKLDIEKLERLRDDQAYTFEQALLALGMNGIEAVDVFSNAIGSAVLWNIKYRQAIKSGITEEAAEAEAWQAVRNSLHTEQPQTWIDKSFGGLNREAFGRAIFYMMSENFNKTATIYGQMRMVFAEGITKEERWKHFSHGVKAWLAYGTANSLIGMMLDYFKDDEDKWEDRDIQGCLYDALARLTTGMPIPGEGLEWILSEIFDAKFYTGSSGKAIIDFGRGWNAGRKLFNMMEEGNHETTQYMQQIVRLGRVLGETGCVASGATDKGIQAIGQYMTLSSALLNPLKRDVDVKDSAAVNK